MTTKKIDGPWIKWHGGECPVPRDLKVMVTLRNGSVRRLARSLRKAAPDHDLPSKALDYLARNGLQCSPLRDGDAVYNAEVSR